MAEKDLKELLLSAIFNKELRSALAKDPETTIKEKGYSATPRQVVGLKQLNPEDWDNITIKELNDRVHGLPRGVEGDEAEPEGIPIS